MRELLAEKSFIYEHEKGDADARQRLTEGALPSRSKEIESIDMLMANTQTEIYGRRRNAIVNLIKEDFSSAIENLDLSDEAGRRQNAILNLI